MNKKACKICKHANADNKYGFISYPFSLINSTADKFTAKIVSKFHSANIPQAQLSNDHESFKIESNICDSCWRFVYQGFYCKKCTTYNYTKNTDSKICCFCKTQYCNKCDDELELFSQDYQCQKCHLNDSTNLGIPEILFTCLIAILIPCLAFRFLITKFLGAIDKFHYSKTQKIFAISAFIVSFPIIYILSILILCFLVILQMVGLALKNKEQYRK